MWNFQNHRVIVTGGTRGIGRGISEAFLRSGAQVIATYQKNDEAALKFQTENENYKDFLDVQKFDVTHYPDVERFFSYLEDKYPSIEVLVNNSGIRQDALLCLMEPQQWHNVVATNLTGTFYMSKLAVLSFMKNRYGRIINITSMGGKMGLPGQANYSASKAGQISMALSLSKEVAKKKITVNNVAPGFVDTELLDDLSDEQTKEYQQRVPMRRFGRVEEVAHGVLFLASREASYITGTTLEISGGLSA